ncbi:hypothetical protein SDRG_06537 [Saprolegnia diclina VS20]|uniref:Uncharacterized protein n=1 Tax=Saprolegnia diclina (strain VS20) TaxID=1156394 RepID=T0RTF2_SAPDV|nr:hypothetical protein SDRG_06537 [Saprolegnia diclina VS20]EQC35778.1 hypothetical protein SDRG_06537 [Saprolegnia diclina VS20]|eukprot:XP_008610540.1 hypothetical protein SDRG_06537 [Saprolegnia diclina VS20]
MLLRIRADGGRKLAKKTGMAAMVDAKPDPYLIVRIDGKSTVFPVVDDVDAAEFTWGADAVRDLPWPATATEMEIHVKDKDLISDHHIGAAKVPLGPIRDALSAPSAKISRNIDLDFADEKLKTKKFSGQITLTFERIEPTPALTTAAAAATVPDAKRDTKESAPEAKPAPPEATPAVANTTPTPPEAKPVAADVQPTAPNAATSVASTAAISAASGAAASETPIATVAPLTEAKTTVAAEGLAPLQPSKALSQKGSLKKAASKINALAPLSTQPSAKTMAPATAAPVDAPPSLPSEKVSLAAETIASGHHLVRVQAVGGRNLAPKSRLERLVDQYPDPYITLVVGSDTRVYPVVDDVKTTEFTWGADAVHEFEIPLGTKSLSVALHVKDKDLVLDHYIGGTTFTLDMDTLLAAKALPDLVYTLEYDNPAFKTKSKTTRGEILLSFFLVTAVQATATPAPLPAVGSPQTPAVGSPQTPAPADAPAETSAKTLIETPSETVVHRRASVESRLYKGSLQVIAHSADGIPIPPRKMLSLDRLADPYVLLKLGAASAELPQAKDGHDKPKWHNALHLFEHFDSSLVPWMDVLIYDKNLVFQDSYLAGARLLLADVLANVTPELPCVLTLPLNLDKLLQPTEKALGTITLSLLFTPDDANHINWTGPSVGCIGFSNFALSVTGDLVSSTMELVLDISIRRHVLATEGFVTQSTDPVAGADAVAWPTTALVVPYGLYLHDGITKDKCPVVLFAVRDRSAILHDKPIALGHVPLLDVLGLHTTKHVVLLSQNSMRSGRATLSVAVAPAKSPRGTSADFAATPGRLRVILLGATLTPSKRQGPYEKVRLTLTAPATTGAVSSVQTDTVDPTAHGALVVLNSVLELQYLASHVANAAEFAPTLSLFTHSSKLLCSLPLPVLSLLQQHEHGEFTLELQHEASTVCVLSMALTVEPSTLPPETIAAVASAVDFGPGYLHIVVLQAEAVVLEGGTSITDLEPEVRVSIKPRYTKDKRVTSSAKTRPLEVVAPNPSWHEYLKLEFIPSDDIATLHVPPTVTLSLNEIKPPGEDSVMHVLGAADLPLAAFLPATANAEPFATKVDLLRGNKSVGSLYIVGIFESLTAPEETRKAVHAHARRLRTTTLSIEGVSSSDGRPGRFEVHLLHATGLCHPPHEPIACDVCVASASDESVRVESQPDESSAGELTWDRQLTLFTRSATSDYLRLDFFVRSIMVGYLKIPIATYSQVPRKAHRELHDIVLKTKDKDARTKPQALLELAFFPDEALPMFAPTATRSSETGRLLLKLDALEPVAVDVLEKKLALRCTLLYATDASVMSAFRVGSKTKVAYGDVLELAVPNKYTQHTSSLGTCPQLRLELVNGSSAFGKEAVSSDDVAIQSLLFHPHMVLTKRLPLSTLGATPSCVGYARVQLVYIPSDAPPKAKAIEYFAVPDDDESASRVLLPQRGVLSVRAIAGRNLEEVDVLGEQDPYIQLRTLPRTYASTTPAFAQSAVCLNSGRHPVWNSPVFPLLVDDVQTTLLSIDVLDSGEEDHVPDALIGSSSVSLAALLAVRDADADASRWSERWFPIVGRGTDAGTVRLEYRFIPDDDARLQSEPPTPYTNCVGGGGTLHVRLLRARHLPCTSGMTPALRAVVDASPGFCHVTRAESKHIRHPVFDEATSCALRWTADRSESVLLQLHIVDVSAHVASASLPILAQTTLHLAPFVIHPGEVHQAWHQLRSFALSNDASEGPSVEVALQFIPLSDTTSTPFAEPVPEAVSGQVHVKILEAAFRSAAVDTPSVRVELRTGSKVQAKSTAPYISPADEYARSVWNESVLFDCETVAESGLPTLRFRVANAATSFGELELPLFPFVLAKGHLCSAWYPLYLQHQLTAQLKVEVQFLRTQSTKPPPPDTSFLSIEVVEGRHLRLAQDGADAQDPFVELTLLGQTLTTKPHVDGGRDPSWNETFEVPLTAWSSSSNLPTLTISVRNADAKKHGAGVIGECHWVIPKDVLLDGKLRDVILKLTGATDGVDVRDDVNDGNGDIQLRLKRGKLPSVVYGDAPQVSLMSAGETSGEAGRATNTAGVLYLFSRAPPTELVTVTVATDVTDASTETKVSLADVGVVRVPSHTEALKRSLPHPATSLRLRLNTGAMSLSADYVRTVLATPLREFRDTYTLGAKPTEAIDLSLVYAMPVQGLLRVSCVAVDDVPVVPGTSYYVEHRILRNSPWTKSPLVKATTSGNLTWKTNLALRELTYSNLTETLPPQTQCVLYAASGDESAVKVAYAQVSLLKYVFAPGTLFPEDVVPLSCVSGRPPGAPRLRLAIGFYPSAAEISPTNDNAMVQAVELAEGTAALKKAFLLLGGDASKPISIDVFRAHALGNDQCMHVLAPAAEAIGGLDKLFAAMDANNDGEISWEEYLDCMQTVHCLADAVLAKPDVVASTLEDEDDEDDESDDDVEVVPQDDPQAVENRPTAPVSVVPTPWATFEPIAPLPALAKGIPDADSDDDAPTSQVTKRNGPPPMIPVPKASPFPSAPAAKAMVAKANVANVASVVRVNEREIATWKVGDVAQWLEHTIELPQYIGSFRDASVDGPLLLTLTADDLEHQLNVQQPLHLRKLVAKIADLQDKYGLESPLPRTSSKHRRAPPVSSKKEAMFAARLDDAKLHELGVHSIQRSKLDVKVKDANRKSKAATAIAAADRRQWNFEYTGAPAPEAPVSVVERLSKVLAEDKSAFDGAMDDVLAQVGVLRPTPPLLRVPLITTTDEAVEILKQSMWRLGHDCVRAENDQRQRDDDAASDFGDAPDARLGDAPSDAADVMSVTFREFTRLQNNGARWLNDSAPTDAKLSRLKFQGGLRSLLNIDLSWHQFDELFRRLDRRKLGELTLSDFVAAFGDPTPGSGLSNDMRVVNEALTRMVERLDDLGLTLLQAWQAFDRDNSGAVSPAEFGTLVKFLTHVEGRDDLTKHQVFLMMGALDTTCDRHIQQPEFLRFVFLVWSHRLGQLQDYVARYEAAYAQHTRSKEFDANFELVLQRKQSLRRALRQNFSRPFRDAMRCAPVAVPGPFQNLLEKLHLSPMSDAHGHTTQIWEVLKGGPLPAETPIATPSTTPKHRKRPHTNELVVTKLRRQRAPERSHSVLRAPPVVALDQTQRLTFDRKKDRAYK